MVMVLIVMIRCLFGTGRKIEGSSTRKESILPNGDPFLPFGIAEKKYFWLPRFSICTLFFANGRIDHPNGVGGFLALRDWIISTTSSLPLLRIHPLTMALIHNLK